MFNFFNKKKQLMAPMTGTIVPLTEVEDDVFSQKIMGDGFAIIPSGNQVIAPTAGQIIQLFKTNHAILFKTADDLDMLFHIGLDTVELAGQGFTSHIQVNQTVEQGDLLLSLDLDYIRSQEKSLISPFLFITMSQLKSFTAHYGPIEAGQPACDYYLA